MITKMRIVRRRYDFINLDRLNDDSIIVEAGACWGYTAECFRQIEQTKNCRIYAIECGRENIKVLKEKKIPNMTIHSRALVGQNSADSIRFFEHFKRPQWGNVFFKRKKLNKFDGAKEYRVKTLKINDIFSFLGIEKIDYLKLDIEGSEQGVLETMTEETASKIGQLNVRDYFPLGVENGHFERIIEYLGFEIKRREFCQIFCERAM